MAKTNTTATTTVAPLNVPTEVFPVADYLAADRKGRAAIRSTIEANMKAALSNGDLASAQAWMAHGNTIREAAGAASESTTTVDYVGLVAQRLFTLEHLSRTAVEVPEGVTVDTEALAARMAELTTDDLDDSLLKLVTSRSLTRRGKANDLNAALVAAFEGLEAGTFLTVADVMRRANEAGFSIATPGGLQARHAAGIEGKWTGHAAIVPVAATADAPRGFRNQQVIEG